MAKQRPSARRGDDRRRSWLERVRPLIASQVGDPSLVERRYGELIAAAARLFQEKGFDRTTIDDIAGRLNISVGAIYRYVERKEDILLLTLARTLWRFQKLGPPPPDGDPAQRLRELIRRYYRVIAADAPSTLLAYRESYVLRGEARQLTKDMELETNRAFEAVLRDGIARGAFRRCRVEVVTYDIVMLGHMWALKRWYLGRLVDLDAYIAEQTDFILSALSRRRGSGERRDRSLPRIPRRV
ncbi:MAG: TetR/AcrR family transcriptional regulator [Deltaproteobacteria bacterium]|nr:TetR/AcrR family transcriptional regulator [Deltaproteobacteria bacterium]